MMNFVHYQLYLDSGQTVEVTVDTQANVKLMTEMDFHNYQSGRSHHYFGGRQTRRIGRIVPGHAGHWNLTIDLGGGVGTIRHSVRIV